jgi:hypothetical protein
LAGFLALGAFFAWLAFFPDLPLAGATLAPFLATRAFLVALGGSLVAVGGGGCGFFSNRCRHVNSPLAVITVTTWITLVRAASKRILGRIGQRRWKGDPSELGPDDRR